MGAEPGEFDTWRILESEFWKGFFVPLPHARDAMGALRSQNDERYSTSAALVPTPAADGEPFSRGVRARPRDDTASSHNRTAVRHGQSIGQSTHRGILGV